MFFNGLIIGIGIGILVVNYINSGDIKYGF